MLCHTLCACLQLADELSAAAAAQFMFSHTLVVTLWFFTLCHTPWLCLQLADKLNKTVASVSGRQTGPLPVMVQVRAG